MAEPWMNVLDQQIQRLLLDMETYKVTTRNKAFEEMTDMLQQRIEEVHETFKVLGRNCQSSWKAIWRSACNGLTLHFEKLKTGSSVENKTKFYETLLRIVCQNANQQTDNIPRKVIFEDLSDFLSDNEKARLLGYIFLRILDQQIFHTTSCLGSITSKEWLKLTSTIFDLYLVPEISDDLIANAIFNVIDVGIKNFPIGSSLFPCLSRFKHFFEQKIRPNIHPELVKVSFTLIYYIIFMQTIIFLNVTKKM